MGLRSFAIVLAGLGALHGQAAPGGFGVGLFLAQAVLGESNFYRTGGSLEASWRLHPQRTIEGRFRAGLLALGPGSKTGPFGRPYDARSEGILVAYDMVFRSADRKLFGFLGLGGCAFRYSYEEVPGTMAFPSTPAQRYSENSAAVAFCAGAGLAFGSGLELELRLTMMKHPVVAATGPIGEAFMAGYLDPAPSHAALGLRWLF
jgi:hypothetical protein